MKAPEALEKAAQHMRDRAAHPGNAVRVQVHFAPLWPVQFWVAF